MCEHILKKHSRTRPDVQFKECLLTTQKTRPRKDYEWIGKPFRKNPIYKIEKKPEKIKAKLPHVNKKNH